MSFEELEPQRKGAKPAVPLKMGLSKMRGARARAYVVFHKPVLEQLGGKAWRYKLAIGKGEDAHHLRITQDDHGAFEATEMRGGAMIVRLPIIDRFPDQKIPTAECRFSVQREHHRIVIDMPSWAWKTPPVIGGSLGGVR